MMRLSSILCASLVGLAALALTAEGASAAGHFTVNTSRFDPYKLRASDPNGEKDCTGKGGKVFTDQDGSKTCKDVQDNAVADTGKKAAKPDSSGKTGGTASPAALPDLDANANAVAIAHTTDKGSKSNGSEKPGVAHTDPTGVLGCEAVKSSATGGAGDGKAGVTARTDSQRGVWKAPAGVEATHCDNGKGATAKDAAEPEWKNVPASQLASKLEESLYRQTKWVVFEPNDEPLWAQIRLKVGDYMMSLYRQGVFQGKTPKDAFFVKCDRSTMTQNDLDNGRLTMLVGFAPLKPAEFVIIKIHQHTRGPK